MGEVLLGRVVSYDKERGLGSLQAASGEEFSFHCTAIADASRQIEPETAVAFLLRPAHAGGCEAASVTKLAPPS